MAARRSPWGGCRSPDFERTLGTLLRIDDDLSAGDRFADAPFAGKLMDAWTRPKIQYQGIEYIPANDPIFTHQYSQAWYDFRNKRGRLRGLFRESVKATKAHKLFCLSLREKFPDYSENLWGISASDYVGGYTRGGGPPPQGPIDGSIPHHAHAILKKKGKRTARRAGHRCSVDGPTAAAVRPPV